MAKSILAIGLNPVLQKTLSFDAFIEGKVNRSTEVHMSSGGKGIHFARAAIHLGSDSCKVLHFLGGISGESVNGFLEDESIDHEAVPIFDTTRGCTTILSRESGLMSELVDPSPRIEASENEAMLALIEANLANAEAIAICGTIPGTIANDVFSLLIEAASDDCLLFMDAYTNVAAILESGTVNILKINADELSELSGIADMETAAAHCLERFSLDALAITNGPANAVLFTPQKQFEYQLPEIGPIINPLGAGDTCSGVFVASFVSGDSIEIAFAKGLAAASASCLSLKAADFSLREMTRIMDGIKIT